jgi:protein SCO1/2
MADPVLRVNGKVNHASLGRVRRRSLLGATALALGLPGLAACDKMPATPVAFKAIDITGANYALDFDLPDADGKRRRLADFKGKLLVVFFGFTHCPDVCPATLVELAAVKKALGKDGERVQGVFITVDPERDTPELLKAYVDNFGAGFAALRGTPDETRALAKHFKVFYSKVPGKTPDSYSIDHTAGSYVFDASGKVRLFTRYGTGQDALVHDLGLLLKQG